MEHSTRFANSCSRTRPPIAGCLPLDRGVLTGSPGCRRKSARKAADTSAGRNWRATGANWSASTGPFEARMATSGRSMKRKKKGIQQTISESESLGEELSQARGQMVRAGKRTPPPTIRKGRESRDKHEMSATKTTNSGAATPTGPRNPGFGNYGSTWRGQTPKSIRAFANLKVLCEEH